MRAALVGLPQSGKSTLFAAAAESSGSHVHLEKPDQEHIAIIKVPDDRVDWLNQHYKPKKKTYAEIEFIDIPGLDFTTDATRSHARTHLAKVRQSDMIIFVLREFHNNSVPPYRNRIDPAADLEELRQEMLLSDLEQVSARIEKLQSALRKPTPDREKNQHELELMQRLQETLEAEKPLTEAVKTESEQKMLRAFAFLTLKPVVVVINCDEDAIGNNQSELSEFAGYPAIRLSAKVEEEIASLPADERAEFFQAMGITTPARDQLVRACYKAMNLISFLTVSKNEVRAWTIPAGTNAITAAGMIHSDMARGFIRAEVIAFDDLKAAGDEKKVKAAGKFRLEGKNYIVQDGDVILFRFNV